MWQTEVSITNSQLKGQFFNFQHGDKMYLCLSIDGVKKGVINTAIKMLGTEIKDQYRLENKMIKISPREIKMFKKYDFTVNSTVNLELGNWDMVNVGSYGYTNGGSPFIVLLQKYLDTYAVSESIKITKRYANGLKTKGDMITMTSVYRGKMKKDKLVVREEESNLADAKRRLSVATNEYRDYRKRYDAKRAEMQKIENMVKNTCTIKGCSSDCHKLPKCTLCQDPYYINISVPLCHIEVRDRSYGFLKSEKAVCSHQVVDRYLKYTGTCKNPNIDGTYWKSIIDRLNKKIREKIPLTEEDAFDLQRIDIDKGTKLMEQIKERNFFQNFARRLQNGLLTDEEFLQLEKYKNKTFADKMRNNMKKITNANVLQLIAQKLNHSQTLTEEDYAKIKKIDPQLEKRIRKSEAIAEITEKIQMTGKISEDDMAKLRKLAPEYAKNFTKALKKQELIKGSLKIIAEKIENGTLTPSDIKELSRIYPTVAEKLKTALRDQLKQKVNEIQGKLKSVKSALDKGLNNTGFIDLQKQLDTLTGSMKPFTKETLRKLQEKITATTASNRTVFEYVYQRLGLDYDIKNLTGNSDDLKRVLHYFFDVLTKIDVPAILKRSSAGVLSGLKNIQEWFQTLSKIVVQACDKCGSKCNNEEYLRYLLDMLRTSMGMFNGNLCKSKWITGFKIKEITYICTNLDLIERFLNKYKTIKRNLCAEMKSNIEKPLIVIVDKWKDARKEISSSKNQWKKSESTKSLLDDSVRFEVLLHTAYSTELGKVKLPILSKDEIVSDTDKLLSKDQSTASLAQIEMLNIVLKHIISTVEKLPNFIKQNGQTSVSVSINIANQIKTLYKKLVDRVMISLNTLCSDRSPKTNPVTARIPILITKAESILSQILTSRTRIALFTESTRFYHLAKYIPETMIAVKQSMLPCKLREEKIKSGEKEIEDTSVKELRLFLNTVKPLSTKTVKQTIDELKHLIIEFKDGIKSPVGQLIDLLSKYIDKSPKFNIAIMISIPPKISVVLLNTFEESMKYMENIFVGISNVIGRCHNCKPGDVFGKENLIEISRKLDLYLEPISKTATEFITALTFAPRGLAPIKNSIEYVRISLQTLWRSYTGFTVEGIKEIVKAFQKTSSAINNIKSDNINELYNTLAGVLNKDIKQHKEILQKINKNLIDLYKISNGKLQYLKTIYEKMESRIGKLSTTSIDIDEMVSPIDRRFKIVVESADVLKEFGGLFEKMYSMHLNSKLIKIIDSKFAPQMSTLLGALKETGGKILSDTRNMVKTIGTRLPSIKDEEFFRIDITKIITSMIKSTGNRKTQLARELLTKTNVASKFLTDYSAKAKELSTKFVGGISKTIDSFKSFKKKMEGYGKIYDAVQSTIKQIKKGPISQIGKIKDSSIELVKSFKHYDLNKLLSSDPKVIPHKVKEMQELFKATAGALGKMDAMTRKCKSCQAEKILGYNYLSTLAGDLDDTFNRMFEKLNIYTNTIGDAVTELQDVRTASKIIKTRFNTIFQKNKFNVDTLKHLSDALSSSSNDVTAIQRSTQNVVKILFDKDVNLEIIGSSINNIFNQLSKIMKKSHDVAVKGERLYLQAQKMKTLFIRLKVNAPKLGEGPLRSRVEVAKQMAAESKILIQNLPMLFQLSNKTLHAVGINTIWVKTLGSHIITLTASIGAVLNKTSQVLTSAEIVVKGTGDIRDKMPEVRKRLLDFVDAPWDKKITAAQIASKQFDQLFNTVIDTSLKSANALGITLIKDDLTSTVITIVGKQRLAKFQGLYNNVTKMALVLEKGPISNIGVLTDSLHTFVGSLSDYDFGKMLLQNPNKLQAKFLEFRQLSQTTGDIIKDISSITSLCKDKNCDAKSIFGDSFITSIIGKLDTKFTEISKNFSSISKRVSKGFKGWESLVNTANTISGRFRGIREGGITKDTFTKLSDALIKSATDVKTLSDGSTMIFQAIFNGDKDMKVLQDNFEGLIQQVSGALKKTSKVLPKVGGVFQSVQDVRKTFHGIKTDLSKITHGPIESRISILKQITEGIKNLGQTLPLVLNQSTSVLSKLGIDSSWFTRVAGKMVSVSDSVSKVVNKTNIIIDGAGLVVKDGREIQVLVGNINKDYKRIVSAPWKEKFQLLENVLGKVSKVFNTTDSIAETVQKTLQKISGKDVDLTGTLATITHCVTGDIGKLKTAVKEVASIQKDITTMLDRVKSGPIQKIGKLTDSTKDFVKSLKNYDIADILILGPKFSKEKLMDLKDIVHESGSLLRNIGSLVKKHCSSCSIDSIFRKGFVKDIADGISGNLKNITKKAEIMLDKVEEGATNVRGIIISVKGIGTEVSKLKDIDFNKEGFDTISDVLHKSSDYLQVITTNSSNVFRMLFNDSVELKKLTSDYGEFITQMRGFLNKAGDFSTNIADAFAEYEKIQNSFKETKSSFKDLTRGPMQSRIGAVKSIANGVNSIMSKFTEIIKTSKMSPSWLKSFGTKLDGITGGISKVLNRTVVIATDVGETVQAVGKVINTGKMISSEFRKLSDAGSLGSKIKLAASIVSHTKTLSGEVNDAVGNASRVFQKATNITIRKTHIFGDATKDILNQISIGITTIADRYQTFQELSKTIQHAFDKINDDPIKFATEDLPKLFDQSTEFVKLIYNDVKGIASRIGMDLDQLNIDKNMVSAAESFYKFAKGALNTIGSGKALVTDFKNLLHSKNFKDGIAKLNKVMKSGDSFIKSIDLLGNDLFKHWDTIKGSFTATLDGIAASAGINFQKLGSYLRKGLKVGGSILNIYDSIKDLLSIKEFNVETLVRAAADIVHMAQAGVAIGQSMGMTIGSTALDNIATAVSVVSSVINIVKGIKSFTHWLHDTCDITYKEETRMKTMTYICYKPVMQRENVKISEEVCTNKTVKVCYGCFYNI